MCCFSGSVRHVARTRIFARALEGGRQALAYSMRFAADADLAMILPLPTPPRSPEDAVTFVDLSGYPTLFEDMLAGFPLSGALSLSRSFAPQPALVVHRVGAFDASFVPHPSDFVRLDPRFRLPETLVDAIPRYADFGFAVFKLHASATVIDAHPMALELPRRDAGTLFFPTVHVHDGEVRPTAHFDHELFAQFAGPPPKSFGSGGLPASAHVDIAKARGLVDAKLEISMCAVQGEHPNDDVTLSA